MAVWLLGAVEASALLGFVNIDADVVGAFFRAEGVESSDL
jgi:hypothetical protein